MSCDIDCSFENLITVDVMLSDNANHVKNEIGK